MDAVTFSIVCSDNIGLSSTARAYCDRVSDDIMEKDTPALVQSSASAVPELLGNEYRQFYVSRVVVVGR